VARAKKKTPAERKKEQEVLQRKMFDLRQPVWPACHPKAGQLVPNNGPFDANILVNGHDCRIELKSVGTNQTDYFYSNKGYGKNFDTWLYYRQAWILSTHAPGKSTTPEDNHYVIFRKPQLKNMYDMWDDVAVSMGEEPLKPPRWQLLSEGMEDEYARWRHKWEHEGGTAAANGTQAMAHIRNLLDTYVPAAQWANCPELVTGYDYVVEKGTKIDIRLRRAFAEYNAVRIRPYTRDLVEAIERYITLYGSL
tara:strand:+ start:191 stop:943 length:753 start_codon:yes stop_codon:yes gene_type:complete